MARLLSRFEWSSDPQTSRNVHIFLARFLFLIQLRKRRSVYRVVPSFSMKGHASCWLAWFYWGNKKTSTCLSVRLDHRRDKETKNRRLRSPSSSVLLSFHDKRRGLVSTRFFTKWTVTYLEARSTILDPSDNQVRVLELAIVGDAEDDVAERGRVHFEGRLLVVDRPEDVVVGVQLDGVLPAIVRWTGTGHSKRRTAEHQHHRNEQALILHCYRHFAALLFRIAEARLRNTGTEREKKRMSISVRHLKKGAIGANELPPHCWL